MKSQLIIHPCSKGRRRLKIFTLLNIEERFISENFTFYVYVTKDGRFKFIDFNPWCAVTLPLLFTWDELEESRGGVEDLDLRVVECAVPYDYIDMSAPSGWDHFLRRADEVLEHQMRSSKAGA